MLMGDWGSDSKRNNENKYTTITVPGTMGMGGRPIVSQVENNPNWQATTQKPSKPSDWQYIGYKKTDSDFDSGSGGGSGSSSSAANYYAAMLAQVQAAQDAAARRAEELARQKQEAAQAAYDKNMGYLNEAYANRNNLLQQNYNDALAQLQASYESGARGVNQNADSAQQQAYINYMMSKRDLPQALVAQGLTGGMSESALAGMYNSYGNNRNTIDRGRNDSLATLLDTLNSNKSTALQNYNNQLSTDEQQKMAYQLQLEQALANQNAEVLQSKYDALQSLDNTYTQQMLALQQAQAEAAAKAASRSYSSGSGNSSVSTSQGDIDESYRINAAKAYQNAYTSAVSNGITDDIATTQAVNAMKQYYYSLFQNNLISADQYAAIMA